MPTHVALLRGINLGGRNRVAMADLRSVASELGHADVSTYIQSGNVELGHGHEAAVPLRRLNRGGRTAVRVAGVCG